MHELMGAILAGGKSTRMGRDKATLVIDQRGIAEPMIEAVSRIAHEACGPVVVSLAGLASPLIGRWPVVLDHRPDAGPLGGIESLLASGMARAYVVCACDTPAMTAPVLRLLAGAAPSPVTALRIRGEAEAQPLPVRVSVDALPIVRRLLDGQRHSIWRLLREAQAHIIEIDPAHAPAFRNVNTPDDLLTR